jgi:hypothetical protein
MAFFISSNIQTTYSFIFAKVSKVASLKSINFCLAVQTNSTTLKAINHKASPNLYKALIKVPKT